MAEEISSPPPSIRIIDTEAEQIGRMYARALIEIAEEENLSETVLEEFDALIKEVLDPHPDFEAVLKSPRIDIEEKSQLLDRVLGGKISDLLLRFLKVVGRHERLDFLRSICQEAHDVYDELHNRYHIEITTAVPLEEHQLNRLREAAGSGGREPYITTYVDPKILGGLVVRVEDSVYDSSVAAQIGRLRQQMIDRSIHEIQSRRDRFSDSAGD